MTFINCNGKISDSAAIISSDNRGFRFGDGLFETMKYNNGKIILVDDHLSRLWNGMRAMKFQIPKLMNPDKLEREILELILKNKLKSARVRLTIYRGDGGLFDPENLTPNYLIQTYPLNENTGLWNENGLELCIYKDAIKSIDSFSNFKSNNFLPYLMGALHAKENKCNDALILNMLGNICDSAIANIFIISNNTIFTPPLTEGCIAGVMRNFFIQFFKSHNYSLIEKPIAIKDVLEAEEIFLTNSIYNMRWVSAIDTKKYSCLLSNKIFQEITQTNPDVIC